jgi:hypothetical protein
VITPVMFSFFDLIIMASDEVTIPKIDVKGCLVGILI